MILTPDIGSIGQGFSHYMADCNMRQHGLSLCEQHCCQIGNSGKNYSVDRKKEGKNISCPPTQPEICPGNVTSALLLYHP